MTLQDPEILASRCRDASARRMIREAVGSYQVGAYRSAVVSTWIAVVYDLFAKLRELSLSGDANAVKKVAEIDAAVQTHTIAAAQAIETTILAVAKDEFDLLSQNEFEDLRRLHEDRHRCAHPSMNRPDEMYSPPPELVRLHLRNAVEHLLSHPPVQGRAGLAALQAEVDSEFLPKTTADIETYFRGGTYGRVKDTLVRAFCAAVISSCVTEDQLQIKLFNRRLRAFLAFRSMYPAVVNGVIEAKLSAAVRRALDPALDRALIAVGQLPDAFPALEQDVQLRLTTYVEHADAEANPKFLRAALRIAPLADAARKRIKTLSGTALPELLRLEKREEFLDRAVELYAGATSFRSSNTFALTLILPNAEVMSTNHVNTILRAFDANEDLYKSTQRAEVLTAFANTGKADPGLLAAACARCELKPEDLKK